MIDSLLAYLLKAGLCLDLEGQAPLLRYPIAVLITVCRFAVLLGSAPSVMNLRKLLCSLTLECWWAASAAVSAIVENNYENVGASSINERHCVLSQERLVLGITEKLSLTESTAVSLHTKKNLAMPV
eukprot:IDg9718t1